MHAAKKHQIIFLSDVIYLKIDFSFRDLDYSLSIRLHVLFAFLVLVERIVALVECLFDLAYEMLMIESEHVWYLFHEVDDISKGQSFTLYNFLVVWSSQIFEFLKSFFLVIKNEILFFSFSSFAMDVWYFIGQVLSSNIYPLIFFAENDQHYVTDFEMSEAWLPVLFGHVEVMNVQIINILLRIGLKESFLVTETKG